MSLRNLVMPVLTGLLAGLLALAVFTFAGPFVELALLRHSGVQGSAEIERYLGASLVLHAYYVCSWTTVVFLSAYVAVKRATDRRFFLAVCTGGAYFLAFLLDFERFQAHPFPYLLFLPSGLAAMLLPARLSRKKPTAG